MGIQDIDKLFKDIPNDLKVLVDVKSVLDRKQIVEAGYRYWSL
jgi:UDP-N-acetyl-D-galactosamine dehydrogenase